MKKTTLVIALLGLMTSFTHAELNTTSVDNAKNFQKTENTIQITTRPEILGLWGVDISNKNNQCTEYYNFRGSNEIVVNSDKEWSIGVFEYQPSPDNTREVLPTMVMQIRYENNEVDCSGNKDDQTGELSQYSVKWENPNQIQFCSTDEEQKCFAKLNRVLP